MTAVRQVSASRAELLAKLGISTTRDLLFCFPRRYLDLTNVVSAAAAPIGQMATVAGVIDEVNAKQPRPRMHILEVSLVDDSGAIWGVWFRQRWLEQKFHPGMRVAFSGKVTFDYGEKRINTPLVEILDEGEGPTRQLVPIYPSTEKLTAKWMRRFVANALDQASDLHDPLPVSLREHYGLESWKAALRGIHFPRTAAERDEARRRLAYEEVLFLQVEMMRRRDAETAGCRPIEHTPGAFVHELEQAMPFKLTDEQQTAVDEIIADMQAPRCMNRMLLGDVSTGKTAVAAFALATAADTGCQAAMMGPTEVLVRQYGTKLGPLLDAVGITWGVLTAATSSEERARLLADTASGKLQVLFGTHAMLEPDVSFARLSLVVIDEQHRFGVNQRAALREKGPGSDLLVMTATPIPRTLALTIYGDLETSYIRHKPVRHAPTTTQLVSRGRRDIAYTAIREAVAAGQQAYVICPLVGVSREQRIKGEENGSLQASLLDGRDVSDAKAAEEEAKRLSREVFPGYAIDLLTGRMNNAEKQQVMEDFRAGKIDVLVATTVVEVGVDVPNATVMLIEDAERFGLSQLHQLRGRVGRGSEPGRVFLIADPPADDDAMQARMQALVDTDDGFELAEIDLKTRREGDVLGVRQHGRQLLKLVNVIDDAPLIAAAHADARALLDADPQLTNPENRRFAQELAARFTDAYESESARG